MISVIQKLGPHYSLARWLLCSTGLIRYLYPTDSELRELANIPKEKSKNRKNPKAQTNGKTTVDTFHIPRSLDIKLDSIKITRQDVIHIRYYTEYQWLVDFSVYAAVIYGATELYQVWFPLKNEINLSMVWCFLVILFAIKLLLGLTVQYFKGEESIGERSTCIVMGFIYLLISMMVLIVDEKTLEIGLEDAYDSFNKSASVFLEKQGLSSTYFQDNKLKQLLLNFTFALPFILVIFWIKPVSRDYLTDRIFSGRSEPLMTKDAFDSFRLLAIVATMCLKLVLMPWYLQAYLDMAFHRLENQKKEAGRITNTELQKQIAAVFYYLCVVTLQYVAPIVLCSFFTLMYKTLGEYQWTGELLKYQPSDNDTMVATEKSLPNMEIFGSSEDSKSISDTAAEFHLTLESLKSVFPKTVFRGLFGFATWWCCFLYFATTSFGLIYQSYFSNF
ncbi:unnamed protein product [Diabrotica balteata]|uniref:Transmembrane protein 161B n=1 Tax=Diabrotica balteata TaxID=107213 RepID=A0A9N9T9A5_DIABA|nr:unnamed protein product [Diabrotica balteata]